jgi:hypothetical protein
MLMMGIDLTAQTTFRSKRSLNEVSNEHMIGNVVLQLPYRLLRRIMTKSSSCTGNLQQLARQCPSLHFTMLPLPLAYI